MTVPDARSPTSTPRTRSCARGSVEELGRRRAAKDSLLGAERAAPRLPQRRPSARRPPTARDRRHRVPFYETDAMGIVHHSNYVR